MDSRVSRGQLSAGRQSGVAAILCALALSSCTAVHWVNSEGQIKHFGLVAQRKTQLAVGQRVTVYSLGPSLSLVPGRIGYALGFSWWTDELPETHYVETPAELQRSVARWIDGAPETAPVESSRWRWLSCSSPAAGAARLTSSSVGLSIETASQARSVGLGFVSTSWVTSWALSWNNVLLRRDGPEPETTYSILWRPATSKPATSRPLETP